MVESKERLDYAWLNEFGLVFDGLEPELQKTVVRLGEEGVRNLVAENLKSISYRGRIISSEERVNLLEQLGRLVEQGGGEWEIEEESIKGDHPWDWLVDEIESLEGEE